MQTIDTAPRNRYVILIGPSGYVGTPWRSAVGRWNSIKHRWDDHAGDAFTNGGGEPTHWLEIEEPEESVAFEIELFDDESVREKLTVMTRLDAAFDDERNEVPEQYWEMVDMKPGERIEIAVRRIK